MQVKRSAILFDYESGKYLYGFYSDESFARHMGEWNDPENFDCRGEEVSNELAVYIRDHLLKDEFRTDEYVCTELED